MDTTKTLISFLLGVGVLLSFGTLHYDMISNYIITNTSSNANFTQFNSTFNDITNITASIQQNTGEFAKKSYLNPEKYFDAVIVFGQIGNFIAQLPNVILNYVSLGLGSIGIMLPEWFILTVMAIVTLLFAMVVASYVLKRGDM